MRKKEGNPSSVFSLFHLTSDSDRIHLYTDSGHEGSRSGAPKEEEEVKKLLESLQVI